MHNIETRVGRCAETICYDPALVFGKIPKVPGVDWNRAVPAKSSHPLPSIIWNHHQTRIGYQDQLLRWHPSLQLLRWRCNELYHHDPWGHIRRWPAGQRIIPFPLNRRRSHRYVLFTLFSGMRSKSWKTALTHFSQRYKSACEIV